MNRTVDPSLNNSSKDNERIIYIDIAKCIGMFMVIHNHLGLKYSNNIIKILFASFHMPLFFFLSGIVKSDNIDERRLEDYFLKRVATILIPFYLWSFVFMNFDLKSFAYILYGSNRSISAAGGVGGSWFLPCFFLADMLFIFSKKLLRKNIILESIMAISAFLGGWILNYVDLSLGYFMSFDIALCGLGFIITGDILRKTGIIKKIYNNSTLKNIVLFIVFLIAAFGIAVLNKTSYENEYFRPVMALGYYGNYILFILTGLLGSFSIIFISIVLERTNNISIAQQIGENTFCILLVQQICINCSEKVIRRLIFIQNPIGAVVISVLLLIISHYFSMLITFIVPNFKGKYLFKR